MKTRFGFVSNSSSSSFVVAFPKELEVTEENVMAQMFPGASKDSIISKYSHSASAQQIVEIVIKDMIEQRDRRACGGLIDDYGKMISDDEYAVDILVDAYPTIIKNEVPPECPWRCDFEDDENPNAYEEAYAKYTSDMNMFTSRIMAAVKQKIGEGFDLYHFKYSDNDGAFYSLMEHAGIFSNLTHWTRSNH